MTLISVHSDEDCSELLINPKDIVCLCVRDGIGYLEMPGWNRSVRITNNDTAFLMDFLEFNSVVHRRRNET